MLITVLSVVFPLALVGAVSPVMLSEQTFLLSQRDGRRIATRYAIGVAVTVALIVSALVLFGRSIRLPEQPRLSATLDIALGSLLIALATFLHRRHERARPKKSHRRAMTPNTALGFGVFSMATNFTTLAILVPAAKEIAASDLDAVGRVFVVLFVVVMAAVPAWLPLALTKLAPGPADRWLAALADLISRRGSLVTVLLLAALGLFLLGRGTLHLVVG